jgi:septal ring factor EnvC (AmiA/AmiB activator)
VPRSLRASASTGQSERVAVLERELEEARAELSSLRLARASEREESAARVESMQSTLHHNSVAVANLRCDLEVQRGNVSTLRTMNDSFASNSRFPR